MRWIAAPFIAVSLFAIAAHGQTDKNATFAITPGSSFSASTSAVEKKPAPRSSSLIKAISADLEELLEIVQRHHVSGRALRVDKFVGSAITTALEQLDPHSNYFNPDEFRELNDGHRGRYFGIGTTISNFENNGMIETFVLAVKPGTPAERAGLRFSDRIISVDGKNTSRKDSLEVRNLIRGPLNSVTKITVERADGTILKDTVIKRDRVAEKSVATSLMLDEVSGYISLTEGFDYATSAEFDTAFRSLKLRGMKSLIVDLRGNGGGLMDQAVIIAEKFLPFGYSIVSQRGRYVAENREWRSRNRNAETLPLILLVDNGTASAAEILAAAMQDNDRATIIGERTFGKGLVQDVIPLEDGSGLALTSARYYTPAGRTLQREYSDQGLYDYFNHTNQGALIDRPENAVKTRSGRTVFAGDGIQPDLVVKGFETSAARTKLLDRMFAAIRGGRDLSDDSKLIEICNAASLKLKCSDELPYMRVNSAQLYSLKFRSSGKFTADSLLSDPQVENAIRILRAR